MSYFWKMPLIVVKKIKEENNNWSKNSFKFSHIKNKFSCRFKLISYESVWTLVSFELALDNLSAMYSNSSLLMNFIISSIFEGKVKISKICYDQEIRILFLRFSFMPWKCVYMILEETQNPDQFIISYTKNLFSSWYWSFNMWIFVITVVQSGSIGKWFQKIKWMIKLWI